MIYFIKLYLNINKINYYNISPKVGCTTGGALPSINVVNGCFKGAKIIEIQVVLNSISNYIIEKMK